MVARSSGLDSAESSQMCFISIGHITSYILE